LDAAARLFARYGFDKTSVDDIAREAGVSKGAVYLHFPSKDALFDATLMRESMRLLDDVLRRLDADPAGGTLAAIYRHSILALGANPLLAALYTLDARVLGDYARRQDPRLYARRMTFGEEFIRRMQAAGLIRPELDPRMTAYVMGVLSFGVLSMLQLAPTVPTPSLDDLAEALSDLVGQGLATGDAQASESGKAAYRAVVEDSKRLYAEQLEAANGLQRRAARPH
jgi:TetR/AcrR family acrAB operon transcriptional repressor